LKGTVHLKMTIRSSFTKDILKNVTKHSSISFQHWKSMEQLSG